MRNTLSPSWVQLISNKGKEHVKVGLHPIEDTYSYDSKVPKLLRLSQNSDPLYGQPPCCSPVPTKLRRSECLAMELKLGGHTVAEPETKPGARRHRQPGGGLWFPPLDHTRTGLRMLQTPIGKSISRPTYVMRNQPSEKFALAKCPTLPDSVPRIKMNGPNKHRLIV